MLKLKGRVNGSVAKFFRSGGKKERTTSWEKMISQKTFSLKQSLRTLPNVHSARAFGTSKMLEREEVRRGGEGLLTFF